MSNAVTTLRSNGVRVGVADRVGVDGDADHAAPVEDVQQQPEHVVAAALDHWARVRLGDREGKGDGQEGGRGRGKGKRPEGEREKGRRVTGPQMRTLDSLSLSLFKTYSCSIGSLPPSTMHPFLSGSFSSMCPFPSVSSLTLSHILSPFLALSLSLSPLFFVSLLRVPCTRARRFLCPTRSTLSGRGRRSSGETRSTGCRPYPPPRA